MFLGRDKQPGAGCLVGGLGCQAVGLSVRQGQPGAAARSWAAVSALVLDDILFLAKGFPALVTLKRFLSTMEMFVLCKIRFVAEEFPTYLTGKGASPA